MNDLYTYDELLKKHVDLQDKHIELTKEYIALKQAIDKAGQRANEIIKQGLDQWAE